MWKKSSWSRVWLLHKFSLLQSVTRRNSVVRFGPVQRTLCLNLGLDLEGPVRQVRFGYSIGPNLEPPRFCINFAEKQCKYYIVSCSRSGMSLQIIYIRVVGYKDLEGVLFSIGSSRESERQKTENKICKWWYRSFLSIQIDRKRYIHIRNGFYTVRMNTTSHCWVLGAAGGEKGEIPKMESATEG